MKKTLCIASLMAFFVFGAEPSAFKAGDLDLPNPYGLTSSEKKIVEQNKNLKKLSAKLFDTAQSQQELRNEIDGLKSLVIGHSEKIKEFDRRIDSDDNNSLKTLEKRFNENLKLQNENYDKIMATLSAIAALLDETREKYVSKEQLKAIVGKSYKEINNKKSKTQVADINKSVPHTKASSDEINTQVQPKKDKTEKLLSAEDLFKKAQQDFAANNLKEAKEGFENVKKIDSEYKKATLAYYLGEIDYRNGDYKAALEHYQESIELDEKATYVPTILYHTGISLEKLGDKESAKKIFNSLIINYPKDSLAKAAKKKLAEMK